MNWKTEEEFQTQAISYGVPEHNIGGLWRFINNGIKPGSFLCAVLCNDLMDTFARADSENRRAVPEIMNFIGNEIPMDCYGSPQKVEQWIAYIRKLKMYEAENG